MLVYPIDVTWENVRLVSRTLLTHIKVLHYTAISAASPTTCTVSIIDIFFMLLFCFFLSGEHVGVLAKCCSEYLTNWEPTKSRAACYCLLCSSIHRIRYSPRCQGHIAYHPLSVPPSELQHQQHSRYGCCGLSSRLLGFRCLCF